MPFSEFGFEQVFGFRPPTPEESHEIAQKLNIKFLPGGHPIGSGAFFDVEELRDAGMDYIQIMGRHHAEEYGMDEEGATMAVYAGFIGALEMISTIQLKVNE